MYSLFEANYMMRTDHFDKCRKLSGPVYGQCMQCISYCIPERCHAVFGKGKDVMIG